jgi:hypothetical protein
MTIKPFAPPGLEPLNDRQPWMLYGFPAPAGGTGKWFGPSSDCGCCDSGGPCWSCAKPLGVNIAWPASTATPCGDCDFYQGNLLVADAAYDRLENDEGTLLESACSAAWGQIYTCCTSNFIMVLLTNYVMKVETFFGAPRATFSVFLGETKFIVDEVSPGSGMGDYCTKDWDYLNTLPEEIDGWSKTLASGWPKSAAIIFRETFGSGCPTVDTDLPLLSVSQSTQCPSDATMMTATLLV